MARNLYRFYLYVVFVAMLIFATVGLAMFLQTLFALSGLRGTFSSAPTNQSITQTGVFFGVSWFIAALIGGLHYWLIHRDMSSDPATGGSNAIPRFLLKLDDVVAAPPGARHGARRL